ncbi:MAG TPA: TIGR03617 family F420-dependent LLM class oxidoreductase [Acidimicrobiales bacterium]|nr:TIGR03617 family F420-dependent LLM class oxidoreductase [Acidimicrobiales bacterium]
MKLDAGIGGIESAAQRAADAEAAGYSGVFTAETGSDPFLPLLLAGEATETIDLITEIVVAFARNPMTTAATANDIHRASGGRFILGLGSQIKPHIERRFSMPWSKPAARMREFISALQAIWDCWNNGTKLDFRGDFYSHTLMTPFFNPGPNPNGPPKVYLAAVGDLMTAVAGEVTDGILIHPFTTERYVREVTLPGLEKGAAKAGRSLEDLDVVGPLFIVTGDDEKQRESADGFVRNQIAFYGSTPAYRPVLELHGWGDLQTELNTLSKQGEWVQMAALIDDDVLNAFAIVADSPADVAPAIAKRYGGVIDRVSFYSSWNPTPDQLADIIATLAGT